MKYKEITVSLFLLAALGVPSFSQDTVKDSLEFSRATASSPAELLRGMVSGVRVSSIDGSTNGAFNTNIRGLNTLRGDSQPLWIIDGVILNTALNQNLDAFWQYGFSSYSSPLNSLPSIPEYQIEKIEVIKDISAASVYGARGANGVVLITTKLPSSGERNVTWHSNAGLSLSSRQADIFRAGFTHNHSVGVSGTAAGARYNVSLFLRNTDGVVAGTGSDYAGLSVSFDTKANSVVWFGLNSFLSRGSMSSVASTAYLGYPSLLVSARYPGLFEYDTVQGWEEDYDDDVTDIRSTNSMYFTLNFTPALSLKTTLGVDFQSNNRSIWYGNLTSFGLESNGAASILSSTLFNYNVSSVLSYSRFIAKDHRLVASAGFESAGNINRFNTMNGTDFFSHDLRAKGISIMGSKPLIRKYTREYNQIGAFLRAGWNYRDLAGVEASLRSDASLRYYPMWEKFYPGISAYYKVLPMLTLKAGYGVAGREYHVPYDLTPDYLRSDYPMIESGAEGFFDSLNSLRSSEWNAAAELSLGRVEAALKYYDKVTTDNFAMYSFGKKKGYLWQSAPRTMLFSRSGKIANRGFEADLCFKVVKNRDMSLKVNANLAYNINQVIDILPVDMRGKDVGENTFVSVNVLGYQVSSLFGYLDDGEGGYVDFNGDYRITEVDKQILGKTIPQIHGGLGATFESGRFSAEMLVDGAGLFSVADFNRIIADGRTELSSDYVSRGDFVRLSRLGVAYTVPVSLKQVKSLRISATACNLFTLSSYEGWNPDINCFGNSTLANGIDYGAYPMVRTFIAGITLNF